MPRRRSLAICRTVSLAWMGVAALGLARASAGETVGTSFDRPVDFERHVMGLFSKMGCNSGSCHGSFQGKNGFRLSLFGYDADRDYAALTRDNLGRRINPVDPDHSLLLMKATGQVLHEGGARFGKDSWPYRAFRDWIEAGAPRQRGSGEVAKLEINP